MYVIRIVILGFLLHGCANKKALIDEKTEKEVVGTTRKEVEGETLFHRLSLKVNLPNAIAKLTSLNLVKTNSEALHIETEILSFDAEYLANEELKTLYIQAIENDNANQNHNANDEIFSQDKSDEPTTSFAESIPFELKEDGSLQFLLEEQDHEMVVLVTLKNNLDEIVLQTIVSIKPGQLDVKAVMDIASTVASSMISPLGIDKPLVTPTSFAHFTTLASSFHPYQDEIYKTITNLDDVPLVDVVGTLSSLLLNKLFVDASLQESLIKAASALDQHLKSEGEAQGVSNSNIEEMLSQNLIDTMKEKAKQVIDKE